MYRTKRDRHVPVSLRLKKMASYLAVAAGGVAIVLGAYNYDAIKQRISSPTQIVETLTSYVKVPTKKTAIPVNKNKDSRADAEPICSSEYPAVQVGAADTDQPYMKNVTKFFCVYKGDFDKDGKEEEIGIAERPDGILLFSHRVPYEEGKRGGAGNFITQNSKDFRFHKFVISSLGVGNFAAHSYEISADMPQITVVYSDEGRKKLMVFNQDTAALRVHDGVEYRPIGSAVGDAFYIKDIDGDGKKEIIVVNGGVPKGKEDHVKTRPVTILYWSTALPFYSGIYRDDPPIEIVQDTKHRLSQAAVSKDYAEMKRIKDTADPYVYAAAFTEMLDVSGAEALYRELFGMEQTAFIEQLLSNPSMLDPKFLAVTFLKRFAHHIETRNDHLIGYDAGRGFAVTYDNQVYSGYRTKEEARQAVLDFQKKQREESNRPTVYHERTTVTEEPGRTVKRRTAEVGGPPKTPQQRETERRLQRDPVVQGARESYEKAGALKGDAERAAKGAYERAGALKGDAERGIRGFVDSLSKPGRKR